MPDSDGVSGSPGASQPQGPMGAEQPGPAGSPPSDFKGIESTKVSKLNLTSDQMNKIHELRSSNGYGGKISPLEMWFMEHSKGNPIEGLVMYQRFMQSMMLTCVTTMSSVAKRVEQRQKEQDRDAYGGMA